MKLKESTKSVMRVVGISVRIVVECLPDIIKNDDITYIHIERHSLDRVFRELRVDVSEQELVMGMFSELGYIYLDNRTALVSDNTMGALVVASHNTTKGLFINIAGLFGDSDMKTKKDILGYQGKKSTANFESILGHEIRHVFQSMDYAKRLRDPSSDEYDYDSDPIEIDASFIESLLDNNIENYNDIHKFVNDVMLSFSRKKPLSNKIKSHYKRKVSKFFTMYKNNDNKVIPLLDKLDNFRNRIYREFTEDLSNAESKIKQVIDDKIRNDLKKFGSISNYPDGLQKEYILLQKVEAISLIIKKYLYGDDTSSIPTNSIHLAIATIVYANSVVSIRHVNKIVRKVLYKSGNTLDGTIAYISTNGYFKNSNHIKPINKAITNFKLE